MMDESIKSTHKIDVFKLEKLEKLENSDTLSIVEIPNTEYKYVAKTLEWESRIGQNVCWIQPDLMVNTALPCFNWLVADAKYNEKSEPDKTGLYARIRAKKLREVQSYGILIPCPTEVDLNNPNDYLKTVRYEPPLNTKKGSKGCDDEESPPEGLFFRKYDLEPLMRCKGIFDGENEVIATLKLHGSNLSIFCHQDKMYVRSRNMCKKEETSLPNLTIESLVAKGLDELKAKEIYEQKVLNFKPQKSLWWMPVFNYPGIEKFCRENPKFFVCGEVYGNSFQSGFTYDVGQNEVGFKCFDILDYDKNRWLDFDDVEELCKKYGIPRVPILYRGEFNLQKLIELSQGKDPINSKQKMEGVVLESPKYSVHNKYGRKKVKLVNPDW